MDILCRECGVDRKADADGTNWDEFPGEYMKFATGRGKRSYTCDRCNEQLREGQVIWFMQSCPDDFFDTAEEDYLERPYTIRYVPGLPPRFSEKAKEKETDQAVTAGHPVVKRTGLVGSVRRLLAFE